MRSVFATVYGIDAPDRHPLLASLEAQMRAWPTPAVEGAPAPRERPGRVAVHTAP